MTVILAAHLALRFVRQVAAGRAAQRSPVAASLTLATAVLMMITLVIPLVSAEERVAGGRAITTFGPLMPAYLLQVTGCLGAALLTALRSWKNAREPEVRRQLAAIGGGMLATGGIATVTNGLLSYLSNEFDYCELGTLSTLLFALAVGYPTLADRLFNLRITVRGTVVYGLLLAFVLGGYSSTVFLLTRYLTAGAEKITSFAVLVIAFSLDPLPRYLEEKTHQLLFGERARWGLSRAWAPPEGRASGSPRAPGTPVPLATEVRPLFST